MAAAVSPWGVDGGPHLIVLDEPTNHLDRDSVDALLAAVNGFAGAVVMVSHSDTFLAQCCNEVWVVDKARVRVEHVDKTGGSYGQSFDEVYASLDL